MLEECEDVNGKRPEKALADAGYWSQANAGLEDEQTELFVATTKDWKRRNELREKDPPGGGILTRMDRKSGWNGNSERNEGSGFTASEARLSKPCSDSTLDAAVIGSYCVVRQVHKAEWSLFPATHNLLNLWWSGRGPDSHAVADALAR
jgi:hypothetical protein